MVTQGWPIRVQRRSIFGMAVRPQDGLTWVHVQMQAKQGGAPLNRSDQTSTLPSQAPRRAGFAFEGALMAIGIQWLHVPAATVRRQ